MKTTKTILLVVLGATLVLACDDEIRNLAIPSEQPGLPGLSTAVEPVDVSEEGFDFLEEMQGHWVGANRVIADDYDWFAFDYRPISSSHIHGIFEGGSGGNLFTSFFVADFKDTRTIMARNGGLLSGIYRTSYFVMDSVGLHSDGSKYYRLVDAKGGAATMYMELRFKSDSLYFNAYTSRLGTAGLPTRHMTFKAEKKNMELALTAAATVGYPENTPAWDFSEGFVEEHLFVNEGETETKTASFLALEEADTDVFTLSETARDPFKITDHPYLAYLQVDLVRNPAIEGKEWFLYLSKDPLTDENGFLLSEPFNDVLLFSQIIGDQDQFLVTYLHPGTYYVTAVLEVNADGVPAEGDITHVSQQIVIEPEGVHQITLDNITAQN